MDAVDSILLALLVFADVCIFIQLRRRHARRMNVERVSRAFTTAVRREVILEPLPRKARLLVLQQQVS